MANTTTWSITYPTTANTITPLATHFANLANSTDTALTNLRNETGRLIGTDAQRIALTAPVRREGLLWYSTDTNREWEYDGSNWVNMDMGLIKIWPGSVSGLAQASIASNGDVIVSATSSAGRINIDNVFDLTKYRRFRIVHNYRRPTASASAGVVFRSNTLSDITTPASYYTVQIGSVGNAAPSINVNVGTQMNTNFDCSGSSIFGTWDFNVNDSGTVAIMVGNIAGRGGNYEQKQVTASHEGATANTIRGIGIDYGSTINYAQWSFYAYI